MTHARSGGAGRPRPPHHADIPEIDAVLLDGFDDKANLPGARGTGEPGNAVFNPTGVRVRELPIALEKVLPGLPAAAV